MSPVNTERTNKNQKGKLTLDVYLYYVQLFKRLLLSGGCRDHCNGRLTCERIKLPIRDAASWSKVRERMRQREELVTKRKKEVMVKYEKQQCRLQEEMLTRLSEIKW